MDEERCFRLADLDRPCYRIDRIRTASGKDVAWEQPDLGSGYVHCLYETDVVRVTYQFRPAKLVNLEDVPELPELAHDLIPHYIAAQHFFGQNGKASRSINTEEQTFERMLNDLCLEHYGDPSFYVLHGYNERLL